MNRKFHLREEPVCRAPVVVVVLRKIEPGDQNLAVPATANAERGSIEVKMFKLEAPERKRRYSRQHTPQLQRNPPLLVKQLHVAQLKRGNHAGRMRANGTDTHR